MATYVTLVNLTDQGIRNFSESPKRAKAFEELAKSLGGEVKTTLWTLGAYDVVVITEFPDDETATAAALKSSALGNVRTTSMRAFDSDEMESIIKTAS